MADARGRPKEKKKAKDQGRDMAVEIPRCGFPAPSREVKDAAASRPTFLILCAVMRGIRSCPPWT